MVRRLRAPQRAVDGDGHWLAVLFESKHACEANEP